VADGVGDVPTTGTGVAVELAVGEAAEAGVGELLVSWAGKAAGLPHKRMATAPRRVGNSVFLQQFSIV
jgi:hypothetical protein